MEHIVVIGKAPTHFFNCGTIWPRQIVRDTPTFTKNASFQPGLIGQRGLPA